MTRRSSYPLEPVINTLGDTWRITRGVMIRPRSGQLTDLGRAFCECIGLNPSRLPSILDERRLDLTFWEADAVATKLGLHPAELWPEWADDDSGFG